MIAISLQEPVLTRPADQPGTQTAHAYAGVDPWPIATRQLEEGGKSCNVCHYPQPFEHPAFDAESIAKPQPRDTSQEVVDVTCASCHLTPDGRIRGPFDVSAITRPRASQSALQFHVINTGAGHSVPTGSNRRAVYLKADVVDDSGGVVATQEWMFAPNFGDRSDDIAFVEEDKAGPEPVAATQ